MLLVQRTLRGGAGGEGERSCISSYFLSLYHVWLLFQAWGIVMSGVVPDKRVTRERRWSTFGWPSSFPRAVPKIQSQDQLTCPLLPTLILAYESLIFLPILSAFVSTGTCCCLLFLKTDIATTSPYLAGPSDRCLCKPFFLGAVSTGHLFLFIISTHPLLPTCPSQQLFTNLTLLVSSKLWTLLTYFFLPEYIHFLNTELANALCR